MGTALLTATVSDTFHYFYRTTGIDHCKYYFNQINIENITVFSYVRYEVTS